MYQFLARRDKEQKTKFVTSAEKLAVFLLKRTKNICGKLCGRAI